MKTHNRNQTTLVNLIETELWTYQPFKSVDILCLITEYHYDNNDIFAFPTLGHT